MTTPRTPPGYHWRRGDHGRLWHLEPCTVATDAPTTTVVVLCRDWLARPEFSHAETLTASPCQRCLKAVSRATVPAEETR